MVTGHNPLLSILNTRRLDEIENPRLQCLKSCIMGYNLTAQWIKGSNHHAPDALSRHPTKDPHSEDTIAEHDTQLNPELTILEIRALSSTDSNIPTRLQDLHDIAAQDPQYQELHSIILNGFPAHRHQLPETCKQFWAIKEHLSIDDGLIVHGCQLLIPKTVRPQISNISNIPFQTFATQWGFTHQTSSPRYPQSNSKVEATVKSMKKILELPPA